MAVDAGEVILALIRAAVPGVQVYDGLPIAPPNERPDRYVVAYLETPLAEAGSADGFAVGRLAMWQVSVFATATNTATVQNQARRARATSQAIRDHLIGHRLAAHGGLIVHTSTSRSIPEEPLVSRTDVAVHDQYEARY